jgi:uracil-DNA glycosylase family 4
MTEGKKLKEIEARIRECRKCSLWKGRKFPVPGEGNPSSRVMLVGLGPGYNENEQGRPFVGRAGRFLDELLRLGNLKRGDVYITNVIKCYLPDNRPTQPQIRACTPHLERQIEVIGPEVILALGNVAASHLMKKFGLGPEPVGRVHGRVFPVSNLQFRGRLVPMYHPASALYNPGMKETLKKDWENLKED